MNTIAKIQFHFQMQSEDFARGLYGRWDSFYASCVEDIADEVLTKYSGEDEYIEIDLLELDLGAIEEERLDEQFSLRFREQLDEALSKCLFDSSGKQDVKRIPKKENALQLLCRFLMHGTLSWSASGADRDIHALFLKVIRENGAAFKQFLQTYGHYTSLQQRLVYQFNDPELEKGVGLLAPEGGGFIISYVRFLRDKYKETQQPETTERSYRDAVWMVVYAYLLTQRSSFFDRKSFVTQTIVQLAGKYNISYDALLTLLTHELESFSRRQTVPLELFLILDALRKELTEKQLKGSFIDAAKFYKTIYLSLKQEMKHLPKGVRDALSGILAKPGSCRSFLQNLDEQEIISLVAVVVPQESKFVIEVVKSLDSQKEHGELQGKTGGEFRLLKWQIIFPLLLEKRGTGFNRKQFVWDVLHKVAAHYNIDVILLLEYFAYDPAFLKWADKELKQIFAVLWKDMKPAESETERNEGRNKHFPDTILNELSGKKGLTHSQIKELSRLLRNSHYRKRLIDQTREPERFNLVRLLYVQEQEFILSYVRGLDKLQIQHMFEAKTGGEFSDMKWVFLFTVFSEMPADNFNRRYFVRRVLEQTAAHYNLEYSDLLFYFRQRTDEVHLPFALEQLLDTLYQEEQELWLNIIVRNPQEADKYKLLTVFSYAEREFLKSYLHSLDYYHEKGKIQGKLSGDFISLKWRFVFEVLLKSRDIAFNRKRFISESLHRIAAHYHIPIEDLLLYFKECLESATNNRAFAKVADILRELYEEQTGNRKTVKLSAKNNPLVKDIKEVVTINKKKIMMENETNERLSEYLPNAGLVIISPFFPRLFNMLELTKDNKFKNQEAQVRAAYLLQQTAFGNTDFPESDLLLNKLLTDLGKTFPMPASPGLTNKEIDSVKNMLEGAMTHWPKMKNTSVGGFQEGFLQRAGKLEEKEDTYILTVEEKAYDMLLESLPWNFRIIRFPWMKKLIQVKWR